MNMELMLMLRDVCEWESWDILQIMYQEHIPIFLETSGGLKGPSEIKKRVMNLEKMHQRTYVAIDRWRCYNVWSFCSHIHYFVYVHRILLYNVYHAYSFLPNLHASFSHLKDKQTNTSSNNSTTMFHCKKHTLPCFNGKGQSGMCPKSTTTSKVWRVAETAVRSWGSVVGFGPFFVEVDGWPLCTRESIWH